MKLYLLVNYGSQNGEKFDIRQGHINIFMLINSKAIYMYNEFLTFITDRQYLQFRANIFLYFFIKHR